ncbi:hypothetical protein HKX48_002720 [Thoreauomyces humboldtii]|nr:hypothetical protein HKX48_002720 [Thoreauomyces humboldtii]
MLVYLFFSALTTPLAAVLAATTAGSGSCPDVSRFPTASTDGSSIGFTQACARECVQMSNACVCGSSNPFTDRSCVCSQQSFEDDFTGCAQSDCAGNTGNADVAKFLAYKTGFCAGSVAGPTAAAAAGSSTAEVTEAASSTVLPTSSGAIAASSTSVPMVSSSTSSILSTPSAVPVASLPASSILAPASSVSMSAAVSSHTPVVILASDAQNNVAGGFLAGAMVGVAALAL